MLTKQYLKKKMNDLKVLLSNILYAEMKKNNTHLLDLAKNLKMDEEQLTAILYKEKNISINTFESILNTIKARIQPVMVENFIFSEQKKKAKNYINTIHCNSGRDAKSDYRAFVLEVNVMHKKTFSTKSCVAKETVPNIIRFLEEICNEGNV